MPTEVQTIPGASQFDGSPLGGFFGFATRFSGLTRSTRIVINSVAYTEVQAGPALTTTVRVQLTRPGGAPSEYAIVGNGLASQNLLSPINANAEMRLCGLVLFRDADALGFFWDLQVFTVNKTQPATVAVDYVIVPFGETGARDSQQ